MLPSAVHRGGAGNPRPRLPSLPAHLIRYVMHQVHNPRSALLNLALLSKATCAVLQMLAHICTFLLFCTIGVYVDRQIALQQERTASM